MFFLVKPIKNVKPKGKCENLFTEDLCCSSLQTLMNPVVRKRWTDVTFKSSVTGKKTQLILKGLSTNSF
jgi:hypothetical protein